MKKICYPVKEKVISSSCSDKWEVLERMGEESSYGEIWAACCEKDCDYILKYIPYENDSTKDIILNEINIQNECANLGHLLDLCEENPEDNGLKDLVKTMKVHMKKFD